MSETWFARARSAYELGQLDLAAAECAAGLDHAASASVSDPEAWHLAAVVAWQRGEVDLAWARVMRACELRPTEATYWNTRGAVARSGGDPGQSVAAFMRAVSLAPGHAGAWANLAAVQLESGNAIAAEEAARRAIAINPRDAQGWCNLGNALKLLGRAAEAIPAYEQALSLLPDFALALANLGGLLGELNDTGRAVEQLQRALRIDPGSLPAWINLGQTLQTRGEWELASRCYREALTRGAGPGIELRRGLTLPIIPKSTAEIAAVRQLLDATLTAWEAAPPGPVTDPVHEIGITPFHLAYHAENDVAPLSRLADLYRRIVPGLADPHPAARTAVSNRQGPWRVGFLSRHWHDHSNTRLMAGLVRYWPRDAGDRVVLVGFGERDDRWSRWVARAADESVTLPLHPGHAADALAALNLDVLIYTDVGMEPLTYFLAQRRLAPLQLTTWGVPETSGLPTIDGYLSSVLIEPDGAESHYREPLVRLPLLPTVYPHPEQWQVEGTELRLDETLLEPDELRVIARERRHRSRQRWGYAEADRLYVCPQSLFKLHPEFDTTLGEILDRDRGGRLLLVAGMEPRWTELLLARWSASWSVGGDAAELLSRVRVLPRMRSGEFLDLLAAADVLLDPWHFGGGNTTFEALALGTPVVTWPGRFLRGRVTLGCYRQMELAGEEGAWPLVTSRDAYVETALSIARDREAARSLRERILEAGPRLFGRREVSAAMRRWIAERR
jgi:protein O-GlcNAc transferase